MTRGSLIAGLGWRFMRGRRLLYSSLTVAVATAFLVATYMSLHALSPTTAQRVEQQLGRYGASVDLGGIVPDVQPGRRAPLDRLAAAADRAGLPDLDVELASIDVQATVPGSPRVFYTERDWTAEPLPGRYALSRGHWPSRPGEVTLTNPSALGVEALGELEVFSGRDTFVVVGLAADRYGVFPQVLAAPGTWATLDPSLARDFSATLATPRVYSSTTDTLRMARFVNAAVGHRSRLGIADAAARVETASSLARTAEAVWFERLPAAYRVPAVLLPLLAVLLMIALDDAWLRSRLLALTDAGVARLPAVYALMAAVLATAVVAAAVGAAVGGLTGLAARPLLSAVHPLPLSPLVAPVVPMLSAVGVMLAGWLGALAAMLFGRFERRGRSAMLGTRARRWRDIRRAAALTSACVAIVLAADLRTAAETMVLAACVASAAVLLAPDLVGWAAARLREPNYAALLAKRQLAADQRRATLVVAVMAVSLGLPLGFLTLLDTTLATEQSARVPDVAEGQLYLSGVGGFLHPPSRDVERIVARRLGPAPVAIGYLGSSNGETRVTVPALDDAFVLVVDDPAGAGALVGRRLTAAERRALLGGGLLAWDAPARTQRLVVTHGRRVVRRAPLSSHPVPAPSAAWARGTRGVMLASTARALRFPLTRAATLYDGIGAEQADQARRAVADAGLDGHQVTVHEEPSPVVPRPAQAAAAIALALLVLCIGLSVARAQVAALDRYLRALLAIGIPPSWPRRVLLAQQAAALGLGTALALVVALPPVLAAAWRVPDVVLSIPWTSLVVVIATVHGSMAVVTVVAARSLRAARA